MIRATSGTWLNYATTFAFQVLFVARFGTSHAAAAFVVTVGVAISVAGILISTVQTVAVPRLAAGGSRVHREGLRLLRNLCGTAGVCGAVAGLLAGQVGSWLSPRLDLATVELAALLRIAALFLVLRVVASSLAAIGLARGHRFVPAMAPVFPSILGAIVLLAGADTGAQAVFWALVAGTVLEIGFLLLMVVFPLRLVAATATGAAEATGAILVAFVLLALIAPLERLFAAAHAPADAARYDYAIRSLRSGQQLLIGGLFMATLSDWSNLAAQGARKQLRDAFGSALIIVAILLVLVVAIALVATHDIVALLYQHGRFSGQDTRAVTRIIFIALPGFCAESLVTVMSSPVVALKRHRLLLFNGVIRIAGTVALLALLAPRWGAEGVAVAYSATTAMSLLALVAEIAYLRLWPDDTLRRIRRLLLLPAGTGITVVILLLAAGGAPGLVRAPVVGAVFLVLLFCMQPVRMPRWPRPRPAV